MSNLVIFKGKKDGITISLDADCEFEELKGVLGEKVEDAKSFFSNAKTVITFSGRILTEEQQGELLNIIAEKADLNISFVGEDVFTTYEEHEDVVEQDEPASYSDKLYMPEHMTRFHNSSLRSGQSIRFSGSVVILGDVNAGAEVVAEGNIVVQGAIKGLVHAGCLGDESAYVSALVMTPTQLRIAELITYIPKELSKNKKNVATPCYAYVNIGQIYISPLVNY